MSSESGSTIDDLFKALADPTRRSILDQLRHESLNTGTLCQRNDRMTRAGVINHLKVLEAAELVRVEQRGRERINHLNAQALQEVYDRWLSPYQQLWAPRLADLARTAETPDDPPEDEMSTHPVRAVELIAQQTAHATPERVWEILTTRLDEWWQRPYVDDASEGLTLHLEPGGTLFDSRDGGSSGYALGIVRGYTPARELLIDGEFGIPGAIHGRLAVVLEAADANSTTVTFTHTAIGPIPPDATTNHEEGWRHLASLLCVAASA